MTSRREGWIRTWAAVAMLLLFYVVLEGLRERGWKEREVPKVS
ncbi:MAG: hypothetical protein QG552_3550 [Thermodesulfobacteriota bacterium]|nr:hypothetical protein [Thermodesulfobacteriota bacterium]